MSDKVKLTLKETEDKLTIVFDQDLTKSGYQFYIQYAHLLDGNKTVWCKRLAQTCSCDNHVDINNMQWYPISLKEEITGLKIDYMRFRGNKVLRDFFLMYLGEQEIKDALAELREKDPEHAHWYTYENYLFNYKEPSKFYKARKKLKKKVKKSIKDKVGKW